MQSIDIIKKPLITEKSMQSGQEANCYAFEVDMRATKADIKAAVVDLYKVRVAKVRTQVRKGEYVRSRFGESRLTSWKRAIVQLHPDDKIDLM